MSRRVERMVLVGKLLALRLLQVQTDGSACEFVVDHLGDVVPHIPRIDDTDNRVGGSGMDLRYML